MERLKQLYNPEGSLLRQHQYKMLEMLLDFDRICKKNDIRYWLSSGTLLGAVRHKGFIPWDDDLDVEMLRDDYLKYRNVIASELSNIYVLQDYVSDSNYVAAYSKLRHLHSKIFEKGNKDLKYKYRGIYIDIFLLEHINKKSAVLSSYLHTILFNISRSKASFSILIKFYRSILTLLLYPIIRVFNFRGSKNVLRDCLGSRCYTPRYVHDIFPLNYIEFEGHLFPVPNNYDHYLKVMYGDYWQIPSNIETHTLNIEFLE